MMSVHLKHDPRKCGVSVMTMRDGQLAKITVPHDNFLVGMIVQRVYNDLRVVGQPGQDGWSNLFKTEGYGMMVEILKNGTYLVVENNE
jgi:hypothetical protein